jgi:hypothetical protein
LNPIRKCKTYRPKFGQGNKGLSLNGIGIDTDLMYAAHRAAGGMTSIYRQIGIGCERLFRAVLVDTTGYTAPEFATGSYTVKTRTGKSKTLSLDGRLELSEIKNKTVLSNVKNWIKDYCADSDEVTEPANGIVFEVRQGYKSKDSKRQNADIDNAIVAWANDYLPVFAIFSSQIDSDIVLRYRNNRCGILIGTTNNDASASRYAFCEQVLGYALADFFERQSTAIKKEIHEILETLLSVES